MGTYVSLFAGILMGIAAVLQYFEHPGSWGWVVTAVGAIALLIIFAFQNMKNHQKKI